jgi:hypothetical protein
MIIRNIVNNFQILILIVLNYSQIPIFIKCMVDLEPTLPCSKKKLLNFWHQQKTKLCCIVMYEECWFFYLIKGYDAGEAAKGMKKSFAGAVRDLAGKEAAIEVILVSSLDQNGAPKQAKCLRLTSADQLAKKSKVLDEAISEEDVSEGKFLLNQSVDLQVMNAIKNSGYRGLTLKELRAVMGNCSRYIILPYLRLLCGESRRGENSKKSNPKIKKIMESVGKIRRYRYVLNEKINKIPSANVNLCSICQASNLESVILKCAACDNWKHEECEYRPNETWVCSIQCSKRIEPQSANFSISAAARRFKILELLSAEKVLLMDASFLDRLATLLGTGKIDRKTLVRDVDLLHLQKKVLKHHASFFTVKGNKQIKSLIIDITLTPSDPIVTEFIRTQNEQSIEKKPIQTTIAKVVGSVEFDTLEILNERIDRTPRKSKEKDDQLFNDLIWNGFLTGSMVRARILHEWLFHNFALNEIVNESSQGVFNLEQVLRLMPLRIYLAVIGCDDRSDDFEGTLNESSVLNGPFSSLTLPLINDTRLEVYLYEAMSLLMKMHLIISLNGDEWRTRSSALYVPTKIPILDFTENPPSIIRYVQISNANVLRRVWIEYDSKARSVLENIEKGALSLPKDHWFIFRRANWMAKFPFAQSIAKELRALLKAKYNDELIMAESLRLGVLPRHIMTFFEYTSFQTEAFKFRRHQIRDIRVKRLSNKKVQHANSKGEASIFKRATSQTRRDKWKVADDESLIFAYGICSHYYQKGFWKVIHAAFPSYSISQLRNRFKKKLASDPMFVNAVQRASNLWPVFLADYCKEQDIPSVDAISNIIVEERFAEFLKLFKEAALHYSLDEVGSATQALANIRDVESEYSKLSILYQSSIGLLVSINDKREPFIDRDSILTEKLKVLFKVSRT